MADARWSLLLPLALLLLAGLVGVRRRRWLPVGGTVDTARVPRVLTARTPAACPACCRPAVSPVPDGAPCPMVRPWGEVKSRRGAPKRIATDGFAWYYPWTRWIIRGRLPLRL